MNSLQRTTGSKGLMHFPSSRTYSASHSDQSRLLSQDNVVGKFQHLLLQKHIKVNTIK